MCTQTERNSADDSFCCRIHNESVQHGVAREEEDLKDDSLIANKLRIVGINYMLRPRNTPLPEIAFGNHLLVCPHFGQATLLVAFGLCVR